MSLLMKALEKAAKDKEGAGDERAAAAAARTPASAGAGATKSELSLEPIAQQQQTATLSAPAREPSAGTPAATARGATATAARVIGAGQRDRHGLGAYARDHPLMLFGILAALILAGYGGYLYLQLTNPGLFVKPPPRAAPPTASAPPPATVPSAGTVSAPRPAIPSSSLVLPAPGAAGKDNNRAARPPAVAAGGAASPPAPAPPAATPPAAPQPPRDTIRITKGGASPVISPLLAEAYAALSAGDLEFSQRLYERLLRSEPDNIDGLLGLAAIAIQQGKNDAATKHYVRILELDPRHALAQAGLIGIIGRADPLAAETRVKQLISREPSTAYLYFTLGNLYVDQNRWPDAQQAFFQAHHLQPDNADYAYNLAVALEHIGQSRPALDFYRRATQLAAASGRANFGTAAALERISKLEKIVR